MLVAGGGMAGLVAAARARELGAAPVVLEKGDRPGGSMLLSSGVVWRHRRFEDFRAECPDGDEALQRRIWEELDDALAWLESLGAPVLARETGNPLTTGARLDPRGLTETLVRRAGEVRLGHALPSDPGGTAVVLATGGFAARRAREEPLRLRASPWSDGGGIAHGRARGAALTGGQDEFYGRAVPAEPARLEERDYVAAAQLYGRHARVVDDEGVAFFEGKPAWHENDLVQAIARRPGARAWYVVHERDLGRPVRERTVADLVQAARELGGEVVADPPHVRVHVQAAITHTIGGLRVDERARVLDGAGEPIPGLYAAGCDAGGWSNGGYASGLAAALVLGRAAAEEAAS